MRIKRTLDIEAVLRVLRSDSFVDLDEAIGITAPEPPENPNEIVNTDVFLTLKPGVERTVVVLRSDGLSYGTIGQIMGLSEGQVKNLMGNIRKRVTAQFDKYHR